VLRVGAFSKERLRSQRLLALFPHREIDLLYYVMRIWFYACLSGINFWIDMNFANIRI
jgi:hypothetical protein